MHQTLRELLAGNAAHVEGLPDGHFADVQDGQSPAVVSMCCSDSRVPQTGMWNVDEPGWLFTPSTIGNQTWDRREEELVVDGNLLYPVQYAGTETIAVVGHTGCGAITAAYEAVTGADAGHPSGIEKWVDLLVPVVEDGLESDRVDADADDVIDQLVEYNVHRQVEFLREATDVPEEASIYGFVYDFQRVYGDEPGRTYLVNADGERDQGALEELVPEEYAVAVESLLSERS